MKLEKKLRSLATLYRVNQGKHFDLQRFDPGDTAGLSAQVKNGSAELLQHSTEQLSDLQDKLFAQDRWALLLIFQAMDAAGKDGTIKHVMSGVNPQGCEVFSFKAPSAEELNHEYLWRTSRSMPARGRIGIFNRSYYEEVLVVRVHPELLEAQNLPVECMNNGNIWQERFDDICAFERYATRNGVVIRKFFLHVSKEEQKRRFLARLDQPEKNWKFSAADVHERRFWRQYQDCYQDMIRHTAAKHAPWFIVPADHKWFARLVVSSVVVHALQQLNLSYPEVSQEKRRSLAAARKELESEGKTKTKKKAAAKSSASRSS
jgi:PPK2 family polyphosphate:nucleotide phosphotransferase